MTALAEKATPPLDLNALDTIVRNATDGTWTFHSYGYHEDGYCVRSGTREIAEDCARNDAVFITTFGPAMVRLMLAEMRAARLAGYGGQR